MSIYSSRCLSKRHIILELNAQNPALFPLLPRGLAKHLKQEQSSIFKDYFVSFPLFLFY